MRRSRKRGGAYIFQGGLTARLRSMGDVESRPGLAQRPWPSKSIPSFPPPSAPSPTTPSPAIPSHIRLGLSGPATNPFSSHHRPILSDPRDESATEMLIRVLLNRPSHLRTLLLSSHRPYLLSHLSLTSRR